MHYLNFSLRFLPLLLLPTLINAQDALGDPCTALDGSYTGTNPSCLSDFCRSGTCSDPYNIINVGIPCTANNQCANAEAADQPPSCGGRPGGFTLLCGGTSSSCYALDTTGTGASPVCASGQCRDYLCTAPDAVGPGGTCTANYDCSLLRDSCSNGICTDVGTSCTATDGSSTGVSDTCDGGYCRQAACAAIPTRQLGQTCTSDDVCIGQGFLDIPTFCAGDGLAEPTCGGGGAYCLSSTGEDTGPSPTCFSGQCKDSKCTLVTPVAPGAACSGSFECPGGVTCVKGFCTGGEDTCEATDGNAQQIGPSTDCTSNFCRAGTCSNVPVAVLGDSCDDDRDCSGSDNNPLKDLLSCGRPGASVIRRCGSNGAACLAIDGSGTGVAPDLCISGKCFNYCCEETAPSPGLAERASLPTQHVIKPRLCARDFEACPVYPSGFECIDVMNDIESCGGCVGRGMVGIDCSADIHARDISCVKGKCIISCEPGFSLAAGNNTCISV